MKMIATHTIKTGGKYYAPGSEFEVKDDEAKSLIETGAAERKTRTVSDDGEGEGDPATDPNLPASGQTVAPDPNKVGHDAKTAKRP